MSQLEKGLALELSNCNCRNTFDDSPIISSCSVNLDFKTIPALRENTVRSLELSEERALILRSSELSTNDSSSTGKAKPKLRSMDTVDFLTSSDTIKELISSPFGSEGAFFAVHKMGETLILDSLPENILKSDIMSPPVQQMNVSSRLGDSGSILSGVQEVPVESKTSASISSLIGLDVKSEGLGSSDSAKGSDDVELAGVLLHDAIAQNLSEHVEQEEKDSSCIVQLQQGSPHLPPPHHYMPEPPSTKTPALPVQQLFMWELHGMQLAVDSNLRIYSTGNHPAITVQPFDISKEVELGTCLDYYLDNVMANVPELALCMHSKGFVRGIRICNTEDIPYIKTDDLVPGKGDLPQTPPPTTTAPKKTPDTGPLFDATTLDLNAGAILRFLKDNCRRDNCTYIMRSGIGSGGVSALELFDLSAMSNSKQKRWKWLLAMMSYRFATRLGCHTNVGTPSVRAQIRARQLRLYQSCFELLQQLELLGGDDHATIRAAVLEHMADTHLGHIDEYRDQQNKLKSIQNRSPSAGAGLTDENESIDDDELDDDCNLVQELSDAIQLLLKSFQGIEVKIQSHLASCDTVDSSVAVPETAMFSDVSRTITVGNQSFTLVLEENAPEVDKEQELSVEGENDGEEGDEMSAEDSSDMANQLVFESLLVQMAGIFHKLLQTSLCLVEECSSNSNILECITTLHILVNPCRVWTFYKLKFLAHYVDYEQCNEEGETSSTNSVNPNPLYNADTALFQSIPLMWNLFGDVCRQVWKRTSGVSVTACRPFIREITGACNCISMSVLCGSSDDYHTYLASGFLKVTNTVHEASFSLKADCEWFGVCSNYLAEDAFQSALVNVYGIVSPFVLVSEHDNLLVGDEYFETNEELQALLLIAYCHTAASVLYYYDKCKGSQRTQGKNEPTTHKVKVRPVGQSKRKSKQKRHDSDKVLPTKTFPEVIFDAKSTEYNRRLADCCNQIGQRMLMAAVTAVQQPAAASAPLILSHKSCSSMSISSLLELSQLFFQSGMSLFTCTKDDSNVAMLLCNMCSLQRFYSSCCDKEDICFSPPTRSAAPVKSVMDYLDRALTFCQQGHIVLKQRNEITCRAWDTVSTEAAHTCLAIGIHKRVQHFPKSLKPDENSAKASKSAGFPVYFDMKKENEVLSPLTTALNIFTELKNDRQLAAVNYQVGALHSVTWQLEVTRTLHKRFGDALKHYQAALSYYSKHDIGPTLVLILNDMSDLYYASHPVLLDMLTDSPNTDPPTSLKPAYVLWMSLSMLFESRSAFTDTVVTNSQMTPLIGEVGTRLCKVLMKMLSTVKDKGTKTESISEIRQLCSELLRREQSREFSSQRLHAMLEIIYKNDWLLNCVYAQV